ncbi:MAG: hypothetical protein PHZ07_00545 [Patescibacteria group bacterium]|nr:hypothetical protein [Patescibacteria group bacterium]MDD4304211.1 hypothetical protein [Patescibacteria group bacterium]MDD4695244.1 hypothetical protein [Patescibacteria group bacterium]
MKNNYFDKKLVVLFIIMLVMVSFMFYFLKTNSLQTENIQTESAHNVNNIDILEAKKNAINKLLDDIDKSFDEDLENFLNDMRSYVNLPLKADKVGNDYPFGNYIDTNEKNIQDETNKKD